MNERAGRVLERLAVVALLAAALAVRLPLMVLGYDADEVGTVTDASFWRILDNPETAVNPPLWRWMWCLALSPWEAPHWGRRFSLLCSVAAVALGWIAGRRASGSWLGGLLAGGLLAFHPWAIRYGAMFRIYAFWSAVALTHLLAVGGLLAAPPDRRARWRVLVVTTAVLLPWIHYFSVPVLLGLGVTLLVGFGGRRREVLLYVPAALGTAPLWPYLLGEGRRVAPDREPIVQVMERLGSLDLHPPAVVWSEVGRVIARSTGTWPPLGEVMLVSVAVLLGVALAGWRRLPAEGRLAVGGHLSVLAGAAAFSIVQYVRPSTLVMVVTFAGAALASAARVVPEGWRRQLVLVAVVAWFGAELRGRYQTEAAHWSVELASPTIARDWRAWDEARQGRAIVVSPAHSLWTVWFHLANTVPRNARRGAACEGWSPCFEHEGVAWAGVDAVGDGALLDALVVHVDAFRQEGFASRCRTLQDTGTWGVWDCRRGQGDGLPGAGAREEGPGGPPTVPAQ